jgi:hypothetical protein
LLENENDYLKPNFKINIFECKFFIIALNFLTINLFLYIDVTKLETSKSFGAN